jgi:hypothetical protein
MATISKKKLQYLKTFEAHFQLEAQGKNDSNDLKHSLQQYGTS